MDFYYREISFIPSSQSYKEPAFVGKKNGESNIVDVSYSTKLNLKIAPPTRYYCDPALVYSNHVWKDRTSRFAPFASEGNSCYINAVVSAIFSVPSLSQTLQQHFHECAGHGFCLPCVTSDIAKKAFKNHSEPMDLKPLAVKYLKQIRHDFKPHQQQDASEFYEAFGSRFQSDTLLSFDTNGVSERTKHTSLFDLVFNGWHKQTIRCSKCGQSSSDNSSFYMLSINKAKSIQESLNKRFAPEKIEGRICPGCQHATSTLTLSILDEPQCLVLHTNKGLKLNSTEHSITVNDTKYKLVATIDHYGTALSGHYTSNILNAAGQWFTRNDDKISAIHPDKIVTPNTTMLFYDKVQAVEQVGNIAQKKVVEENTSFKLKRTIKETAAQSIDEIFGAAEDLHEDNEEAKQIESRIRTRSYDWERDEMDDEYDAPSVKKLRSEMENRHKKTNELTEKELDKTNKQFFKRQQNPNTRKTYSDTRSKFKPRDRPGKFGKHDNKRKSFNNDNRRGHK